LSTFHARIEYISVTKIGHSTKANEKPPKPSIPLGVRGLHLKHTSTDSIHHPKRHTDTISHVDTIHLSDRSTDRQTDQQMG